MSNRKQLISELSKFQPYNEEERLDVEKAIAFLKTEPKAFKRECLEGHITCSAFVVDESGKFLLLTHHRKIGKWFQLGGHADGNGDTLAVAKQEVWEESGLRDFSSSGQIFDVHIQEVPLFKNIPPHLHYDIRYLFTTKKSAKLSRREVESKELRWVKIDELDTFWANPDSLKRIQAKLYSRIR